MVSKVSIFCLTQTGFADEMVSRLGRGELHARRLYAEWFRRGAVTPEDDWVEPQARALIEAMLREIDFSLPELSHLFEEGGTRKFLLKFSDGRESECVLIPMEAGMTLCVSSQIGCRMGCAFCETAKMGLIRSLSAGEIVQQVFFATRVLGAKVRNLVFMGMGEPFDNFDAVAQALRVLTDSAGMGFGPSRITVSTSGHVAGIRRFTEEAHPAVNLAVSVNAPNHAVRGRLMPVEKTWDMGVLKEALMRYCENPRRQIFAEYVLIAGINDSLEAADQLAAYLRGLRVRVNLIPYNPMRRAVFAAPREEVIQTFGERMRAHGYQTLYRHSKGRGIMAACGQLGKKQKCSG